MSKITRRDFLKTAGVMTLAVAAAGVLSGCEGKPTEPVAPPTANSVTIGNYTLSVKDAKYVVTNEYDKPTGKVDPSKEDRYVVVLCNVVNNDYEFGTAPEFKLSVEKTGMVDNTVITAAAVQKMFDLKDAVVTAGTIGWDAPIKNISKDGVYFYYAFTVESEVADKTSGA